MIRLAQWPCMALVSTGEVPSNVMATSGGCAHCHLRRLTCLPPPRCGHLPTCSGKEGVHI